MPQPIGVVSDAQGRTRHARGRAVAEARYARHLREAGDDPSAVFMAHVDRIRALKNTLLTLTAASLLGGLIERHRAEFTDFTPREVHARPALSDSATCADVGTDTEIHPLQTPVKTDPEETR